MTLPDSAFSPIPPFEETPNWGRLPIEECGEPLVPVADGAGSVRVRPLYFEQGMPGASSIVTVRSGVYQRLLSTALALEPSGVTLVVFDSYRPLAVQEHLYRSFYAEAARDRPELNDDALRAYVGQFVATPTADPLRPPPHRTGGAVDVYLIETESAKTILMGTEPDEISIHSATTAFESDLAQEIYASNRRMLYHAMTNAGFSNYRGEWWHYDFGNQRWANCTAAPHAIYGIAADES